MVNVSLNLKEMDEFLRTEFVIDVKELYINQTRNFIFIDGYCSQKKNLFHVVTKCLDTYVIVPEY